MVMVNCYVSWKAEVPGDINEGGALVRKVGLSNVEGAM